MNGSGRLKTDGKPRSPVGQGSRPGDPAGSHRDVTVEQVHGATGAVPGEHDPNPHRFGGERHLRRHRRDLCRHEVVGEVQAAILHEEHVPAGVTSVGHDDAGKGLDPGVSGQRR